MVRNSCYILGLLLVVADVASADVLCIRAAGRARVIRIRAGDVCRPTEVSIGRFDGSTLTLGIGMKVESADLTVEGGNLHVRNGSGSTDGPVDGTGNLVIGYNEDSGVEDRTGSHNLVLGTFNEYSSSGGIVSGSSNRITNRGAAVLASVGSTASGNTALVAGGNQSVATGIHAVVAGGFANQASGTAATVVGGEGNEATVNLATAAGGLNNRAATFLSTVAGGACNAAGAAAAPSCFTPACTPGGCFETVTGGFANSATGSYATVAGGLSRSAPGPYDWAAGGLFQDF